MRNYAVPLLMAFLPFAAGCTGQSGQSIPTQLGQSGTAQAIPNGTNLVVDGSFESPKVPSGSYTVFGKGTKFGAWTVSGRASGNVAVVSDKFVYGGYTFPAACNHQALDVTGTSNSRNGVEQGVKTVRGAAYTLSFKVGNAYGTGDIGTSSTVFVLVDGKRVMKATNGMGKGLTHMVWKAFSTQVTATSTLTRVSFINGDKPTDTVNGLDCISMTANP